MNRLRVSISGVLALAILVLPVPKLRAQPELGNNDVEPPRAKSDSRKGDEEALKEFLEIYRLAPSKVIKRIPPPRPAGILAFWKRERPGFANRPDQFAAMTFRWSDPDRLVNWAMTTSEAGFSLRDLFRYLELGVYPVEIEGDPELLNTTISGDWIYRSGVPAEQMLEALESTV
jgi:hypothetical protein